MVSRVPRGATIRLPGAASEGDPAVVAADVSNAEFMGFRIVGDAATPLGTGVLIRGGQVLDCGRGNQRRPHRGRRFQSGRGRRPDRQRHPRQPGRGPRDPHRRVAADRPQRLRPERAVRAGPGVAHHRDGAEPSIAGNVFQGVAPKVFLALRDAARLSVVRENWFPDSPPRRAATPAAVARPSRSMMTTVFQRVGPYDILEEIGRGGMAAVFLATDTRTNRRVALKLVPTGTRSRGARNPRRRALGSEAARAILPRQRPCSGRVRARHRLGLLLHRDGVPRGTTISPRSSRPVR